MWGSLEPTLLQATIIATTAGSGEPVIYPHHPITCRDGKLYYEEDGSFHCEHASVGADDLRTAQSVTHSIALLLIELASNL